MLRSDNGENQEVFRWIRSQVLRTVARVTTRDPYGQGFLNLRHSEQGLEVAGLETFRQEQSAERIDFTRLRLPWEHLGVALANDEVLTRRFERVAEQQFVVLADVSASMTYPLRQFHAGRKLEDLDDRLKAEDLLEAKSALLKLVVGAFAGLAAESGFLVRLVTFGHGTIEEGPILRRPREVVVRCLDQLQRGLRAGMRSFDGEYRCCERAIRAYLRRKGIFLFVSDFLDSLWDEQPEQAQRRLLAILRHWGQRRRLVVAHVLHEDEGRPSSDLWDGSYLPNVWHDRCDIRTEDPQTEDKPVDWRGREKTEDAFQRLNRQSHWSSRIKAFSPNRGFLALQNWPSTARLTAEFRKSLQRVWTHVVQR